MATQPLHDFSELASLKAKLSPEENQKEMKTGLRKRRVRSAEPEEELSKTQIPKWPIYFEYNDNIDAVASAVKNYPLIDNIGRKITYQNSKNSYIYRVGKGERMVVFYYHNQIKRRVFQCRERLTAFKVILFCFGELRKIEHIHIRVEESQAAGNFVLYLDEIPVIASSYTMFNGLRKQLKGFKDSLCAGYQKPKTEFELEAQRFGVDLFKRIEDAPYEDKIPVVLSMDYSKFKHIETVRVSSKENALAGKISYGYYHAGPAILPSMRDWDDRFDHDD